LPTIDIDVEMSLSAGWQTGLCVIDDVATREMSCVRELCSAD